MTRMSSIVEFLRARLDEDEAQARDAERIARRDYPNEIGLDPGLDNTFRAWDDYPSGVVIVGPARVLREVEAKRRIMDEWAWSADTDCASDPFHCNDCSGGAEDHNFAREGVRLLAVVAAVYADHPDYDPAWRP